MNLFSWSLTLFKKILFLSLETLTGERFLIVLNVKNLKPETQKKTAGTKEAVGVNHISVIDLFSVTMIKAFGYRVLRGTL